MKKSRFIGMFFICILTLTGCQTPKETPPGPEYPLREEAVMTALEELSLPWAIDKDEIQRTESTALYSLRDPQKKLQEESGKTILYAGVSSAILEGHRRLSVVLPSKSFQLNEKPFSWEDWEQQIILATRLYGSFEDSEEAYRALSKLEIPEEDGWLTWEVPLSGGYCVVKRNQIRSPGPGYVLWINFYESQELYQQEKQEAREKEDF